MGDEELCYHCGERPGGDVGTYCAQCVAEMGATFCDDEKAHVKRLESERKEAIRG